MIGEPSQLMYLFVILLLFAISTTLGGLGLLSANATGTAAAERRVESKVNVLLRIETDDERRDIDDLLADTDVALANENAGVMNGLGKAELVDTSLKAALQEIFELQGKDVIQLHARLVEHTNANETSNEGIAFEETFGVLLVESKQLTSSTTNLGQSQADSPDLTLVAEAILAYELQLRVQSSRLERSAGDTGCLGVGAWRHLDLLL